MQSLEEQLEDLDKWEAESGHPSTLVSRRSDSTGPRTELLDEIKKKLDEYGKHRAERDCILQCKADRLPDRVFLSLHQMQAIKKPTKRNQNSVYNEIEETQSIVSSEAKWIRQKDDLAALGLGAEHGWFNGFIEDKLNKCSKRLLFVSKSLNDPRPFQHCVSQFLGVSRPHVPTRDTLHRVAGYTHTVLRACPRVHITQIPIFLTLKVFPPCPY